MILLAARGQHPRDKLGVWRDMRLADALVIIIKLLNEIYFISPTLFYNELPAGCRELVVKQGRRLQVSVVRTFDLYLLFGMKSRKAGTRLNRFD